jgi:hypothetical protein
VAYRPVERTGRYRPPQTVASPDGLRPCIFPDLGCNMHSDWLSYAVAAAISVIIAIGLWQFGLWGEEHAGDNWENFQASVAKSISHAYERPSRPPPSTNVTHLQTSQP